MSSIEDISRAGEGVSMLMEAHSHDAIGGIECLLYPIAMVDPNINVQHAMVLVVLQQFQNGQDTIIHITKPGCLGLLGMVHAPRPINNRIGLVLIQTYRTPHASTGVKLTELKESIKDGTIFANIEPLESSDVILHVIGGDDSKEIDVIVRVEACHGGGGYTGWTEHFHATVETIIHYEIVSHAETVRFHRVTLAVVVITNLGIVEIGYTTHFDVYFKQ
mmetsp:Transcript_11111/g.16845  ORF Transcript_11111/g.16845 Transcript_11111/m.16845 type:complete len:219 (+) Transcript_11111:796-1452(+)